jgi:hypothetical protein
MNNIRKDNKKRHRKKGGLKEKNLRLKMLED